MNQPPFRTPLPTPLLAKYSYIHPLKIKSQHCLYTYGSFPPPPHVMEDLGYPLKTIALVGNIYS